MPGALLPPQGGDWSRPRQWQKCVVSSTWFSLPRAPMTPRQPAVDPGLGPIRCRGGDLQSGARDSHICLLTEKVHAMLSLTCEPHGGRRLPCGGSRRNGDGFCRRPDRARRRTRCPGRPSPQRQRTLARGVPLRSPAPGLRLLRRRLDPARRRPAAAARTRKESPGAGHPGGDLRLLRPDARPDGGFGQGPVLPQQRVRRRQHSRLAHLGPAFRGARGAGSWTPATWLPASPPRSRRRSASPRTPG